MDFINRLLSFLPFKKFNLKRFWPALDDNNGLDLKDIGLFMLFLPFWAQIILNNPVRCPQDLTLCISLEFVTDIIQMSFRIILFVVSLLILLSMFYLHHDPNRDILFASFPDELMKGVFYP
jgi:hypothetical protein